MARPQKQQDEERESLIDHALAHGGRLPEPLAEASRVSSRNALARLRKRLEE